MIYLTLKLLHIIGAVLFLGNIITGVFWKAHADKSRNPAIMAHALDGIIRSDQLFTIPGVVLIVAAGFAGAIVGGLPLLRTEWLAGGIILLSISGIAFMARIAPLQRQMRDLALANPDPAKFDWAGYERLSRGWAIWGAIATLAPLLAAALMVFKPSW
jgi:uncharacterized membrane protein